MVGHRSPLLQEVRTRSITFLVQSVPDAFRERHRLRRWLERVVRAHDGRIGRLCFVLMSDDGLLGYNIKYLDHHDLTDVITFQDDGTEGVSGDVLISYDRVRENARHLGLGLQEELRRVMVHGVLHLLGYTDKRPDARRRMREQEDRWLEDYASNP